MTIWFILVLAVLTPSSDSDSQFECGSHGRFEYCIDGNPDCIIGCHCHPGYYFDTATKICEPNSKLTLNRRWQHETEQTHASVSQVDSSEVIELSTPSPTTGSFEDHVDAIAKNADDLGDWLYNQFYKTIENQVINRTNGNLITRRSGNGPRVAKIKKKKRKKEKKSSVKRKQKKDDLRRKLLRITEDDSLFDSSTDTDSSDSSSSDETQESSDKEHGHKKFVIFNKKPKPPLPSFIFLPNLETPYYPPIGLPPPALPMYPMVPVPPVLPAYPFPHALPDCNDAGTSNTTITTASTTIATAGTISTQSGTTEPATKTSVDIELTTTTESEHKARLKKRKRKHMRSGGNDMLQRLQEMVKNSAKNSALKNNMQKTQAISAEDLNKETLEKDETHPMEPIQKNNNFQLRTNDDTALQDEDTVDFKYLSQLIHRIDLNNTGNPVSEMTKPYIKTHKPLIDFYKGNRIHNPSPQIQQPSRRFNMQKSPQEPKTSENSFYANLGRQIATLIRGVDSKNDRQINIEIEHMDQNTLSHPIFNELSYAPHSYWERFVRSPIDYLQRYQNKKEHLKKSNEILYNIEDKVEIAVSTMTPMSLIEIENVINIMEGAQNKIKGDYLDPPKQFSNKTLNINLWPQEIPSNNVFVSPAKPSERKMQKYYNYTNNYNLHSDSKSVYMQNVHKFTKWFGTDDTANNNFNEIMKNTKQEKKIDDASKIFSNKNRTSIASANQTNIKFFSKQGIKTPPTRRTNMQYQEISPLFDYNQKRFLSVNNQHPFYNNLLEFQYPTVAKTVKKPLLRAVGPSYFHHEAHHFDYIH